MVHQPELIVCEGVPRIVNRHRARRLAAIGVALVHRDAMEVVLKGLHRVEHGGRPIADLRVQAAPGGDQQWEAGACLLVADTNVTFFVERHGSFSLHSMMHGSHRPDSRDPKPITRPRDMYEPNLHIDTLKLKARDFR